MTENITLLAADLLDKAADGIEQYGWTTDRFTAEGAPMFTAPRCADAAIWLAAGCDPEDRPVENRVAIEAEAIFAEWVVDHGAAPCTGENGDPDHVETIAAWNDAMDAESVIEALRLCARGARCYPSVLADDEVWADAITRWSPLARAVRAATQPAERGAA